MCVCACACSHLEITKCGDVESCGQESRMDICTYTDAVTQGHTPPPYSDGSCKPIHEYPTALGGPAAGEIRPVPPLPTEPPVFLPTAGSPPPPPPPEWGPHSQFWLRYVNTYKCACVCSPFHVKKHPYKHIIQLSYTYICISYVH